MGRRALAGALRVVIALQTRGDVAGALGMAALVIEGVLYEGGQIHFCFEPNIAIATPLEGRLMVRPPRPLASLLLRSKYSLHPPPTPIPPPLSFAPPYLVLG